VVGLLPVGLPMASHSFADPKLHKVELLDPPPTKASTNASGVSGAGLEHAI
jgi:hypothetical protein